MKRTPRARLVPVVLLLAVVAAACGSDSDTATTTTAAAGGNTTTVPDHLVVGAGINDPDDATVAVLAFLPAEVTVEVGTTVTWEWNGAEPHSVTFLAEGTTLPDPGSDEALFAPTPPDGPYDGVSLVNSGLQPLGPEAPAPFELAFDAPGSYSYYCVIHPQMVGKVNVEAEGDKVDSPAEVATRRAADVEKYLAEGRAAKAELVGKPPVTKRNTDGSTTWTIEMGASTPNTDILAFAPTPANVKPGDTIVFLNSSTAPHTATFFGTGAEPITNPTDPRVGPPAPGPSPQVLSDVGFINTGLLPPNAPPGAGPPEAARSFTFTVPRAGSYAYVCLLHQPSNMVGTIEVS